MGVSEDYMVVRRAAVHLERLEAVTRPDVQTVEACAALLRRAAKETGFIRLYKAGIQAEVIDLAYAVLDEKRPEGPAAAPAEEGMT